MSDIDEGLSYQNGWIDGQRASADRIKALEAQLAAADALAKAAYRTIYEDADTSLVYALIAYRVARK